MFKNTTYINLITLEQEMWCGPVRVFSCLASLCFLEEAWCTLLLSDIVPLEVFACKLFVGFQLCCG